MRWRSKARSRSPALVLVSALAMLVCIGQGGCSRSRGGYPPAATGQCEQQGAGDTPLLLPVAAGALEGLLAQEDTDGDRRISVHDEGPRRFDIPLRDGAEFTITGVYPLSNLVQELSLQGTRRPNVELARVFENPVDRVSRRIRTEFWDELTRRIDDTTIVRVLSDPKVSSPGSTAAALSLSHMERCVGPKDGAVAGFLYVPSGDETAWNYYSGIARAGQGLVVCRLPTEITASWVGQLTGPLESQPPASSRHGLLALAVDPVTGPVPYVVPGGRFNELYGWDSYFHVLGLLEDGRADLARAIVDNLLYEVRHYGKVLNANRTYYLTRTQPPLLAGMVLEVWQRSGDQRPGRDWLRQALQTLSDEYEKVWSSSPRATDLCREGVCLARYHGTGQGPPPEVEPGHFDWLYAHRAKALKMEPAAYEVGYLRRSLPPSELAALDEAFEHDRCMRESGHDTTYRWFDVARGEDRCADFVTADLNGLLLKYELDVARLVKAMSLVSQGRDGEQGAGGDAASLWCERAKRRAQLVRQYLWSPRASLFFDYDLLDRRRSAYVSATTLFPLWAVTSDECGVDLLTPGETEALVGAALAALEQPGGLAATSKQAPSAAIRRLSKRLGVPKDELLRQWDYPFGWAPHQVIAWEALRAHGSHQDAERLAWKWLSMITTNARDYHGTVTEKYDVVRGSHEVFAEYGNVGTDFEYVTREGFGWMNASYQLGLSMLSEAARERLRRELAKGR